MKYDTEKCNILNCQNPIYKDGMCKDHYDFYMSEPCVKEIHEKFISLKNGTAGWKSILKLILQNILHHICNIPMPFIEHFPLEHIYVAELYGMRRKEKLDVGRYNIIINDFDREENENKAMMERLLNSREADMTHLKDLNSYLFSRKSKPSILYFVLALLGLITMYLVLKFGHIDDFKFFGCSMTELTFYYKNLVGIVLVVILMISIGLFIPSTYNSLIKRSYDLTLFSEVKDNFELLNQALYVKERNDKGSYYATIIGIMMGIFILESIAYFSFSTVSWQSAIFGIGLFMMIASVLLIHNTMVLYSPLMECMKRRKVKILLYNPDSQGGIKVYHRFLYRTFIYNEGIVICLLELYVKVQNMWLLIFLLFPFLMRANHAGRSLFLYIKSIRMLNKAKAEEKEKLSLLNGVDSMNKSEKLSKVHAIGLFSTLQYVIAIVILPYMINHIDDGWKYFEQLIREIVSIVSL